MCATTPKQNENTPSLSKDSPECFRSPVFELLVIVMRAWAGSVCRCYFFSSVRYAIFPFSVERLAFQPASDMLLAEGLDGVYCQKLLFSRAVGGSFEFMISSICSRVKVIFLSRCRLKNFFNRSYLTILNHYKTIIDMTLNNLCKSILPIESNLN